MISGSFHVGQNLTDTEKQTHTCMKTFQVLSTGKPIFFEVEPEYADDDVSPRNKELADNLANALGLEEHGPAFHPQLISRLPLVVEDRTPDHSQPGLKAWVSPKISR